MTEILLERFAAGQPLPPPKKIYTQLSARLETLVERFDNIVIGEFLRGIAQSFFRHLRTTTLIALKF